MKNFKTFVAALALTVSTALAAAEMPKELNITYVKSPFNLQNIVMKERNMLEESFGKEGVKVNWYVINSGAQQAQALASGSLDASAVMNTASLLMAAANGVDLRVVTGVAHPNSIFAIVGKPGEHLKIADLKGKTVVGPKGTVLHQLLVAALKSEGMAITDVNFVSMDPASALSAILSGKADAGLLAANLIIKAKAAGADVITTAEGLVKPNLVMVAREGFVKDYPEAAALLVKTQRDALAWIKANKEEALKIGAKEQGISVEDAAKLYDWSNFYDTLTEDDIAGMEADQAFLRENGMMEKSVDVKTLVAPSALQ